VDLFGALAVMFVVGAAYTQSKNTDLREAIKNCEEERRQMTAAQVAAEDLLTTARSFGDVPARFCDEGLEEASQVRDTVCLDVRLEFPLDSDEIRSDRDRERLAAIAEGLKTWINGFEEAQAESGGAGRVAKSQVQIVVEGHTDSTQPRGVTEGRTLFKYNWDLSARRASSVMHELGRSGLDQARYNLAAWGQADSDPLCHETADPKCQQQNRRTTIKIRFDSTRRR
jgi:outer membrane protein OmpA-like peptidoglycan-associated protein